MRALALLLLAAPAHAELRPSYGGTAQAALPTGASGFDPLSASLADRELAQLLFDAPFRLDAAGRPVPHLALELTPPPPGAELQPGRARLKLRPGLQFSDGRPLRAADVAASLERAIKDPRGWALGPIARAHAVGDDVVELELTRPAPDLALLLSTAAVTPNGAAPGERPVGSGPFTLASAADGIRLAANPTHFAGRPYLDGLTLRATPGRTEEAQRFEAGALDATRQAAAMPGARRAGESAEGPRALTGFVAAGRTLSDEAAAPIMTAIRLGVDRERLRQKLRDPARAIAGPSDQAAARAAVEKAPQRKVALLVDRGRFDDRAVAERLLVELSRLGLEISIDAVDSPAYLERLQSGGYELALGTAVAPAPELGDLALLAVVDPAAARAQLARAPASGGGAPPRVVPLFQRAARLTHAAELRGLRVDAQGRASWPDARWVRP